MTVGELYKLLPIIRSDSVSSRAKMVTDGSTHGVIRLRPLSRIDSPQTKEPIDRFGVNRAQKFTFRISQQVFRGATDIDRPWCNERQEHMLIEG
jgi:hypothetical protein